MTSFSPTSLLKLSDGESNKSSEVYELVIVTVRTSNRKVKGSILSLKHWDFIRVLHGHQSGEADSRFTSVFRLKCPSSAKGNIAFMQRRLNLLSGNAFFPSAITVNMIFLGALVIETLCSARVVTARLTILDRFVCSNFRSRTLTCTTYPVIHLKFSGCLTPFTRTTPERRLGSFRPAKMSRSLDVTTSCDMKKSTKLVTKTDL